MDIYEISGFKTGLDDSGVNFLDPAEAFEKIRNGYIYRQELKSRMGFVQFGNRLGDQKLTDTPDGSRVMGIFENVDPTGSGIRELLVISKNYLYSYVPATNIFKQIKCAGSLGAAHEFNITSNDEYVSGTTYLTKGGLQRFVFTGKGMSHIYFYDGTNVRDYTSTIAADNPDYKEPTEGALTKATKVHWFNGRINFFVPVIGGVPYQQAVLYSGIRDGTGNGDKFNVAGSGVLSASTYELMKGTHILGDIIVMKFQGSDWTLEKTRDANNPYFVRKVPSVIGTDATFSSVAWNYEVKSFGKNGLTTTDGRRSLRFDNKIPYFTRDQIEEQNIELTYGGFDRFTNQFMYAYREAGSSLEPTDATQDKVLVYNYEEDTWAINDQRFSVFGETTGGKNLTWDDIDETTKASWETWDTTEEIWDRIGIGENVQKTLAGDDEGYVYQLNIDFDDYKAAITEITQAASAVISAAGGFKVGDRVYVESVEGMTEINNQIYEVTAATGAAITVNFDSTLATAYTSGGLVSRVIDFEVKLAPFNPYRDKGRKCYINSIEFLINKNAGSVYVNMYEDEEEVPFKSDIPLVPNSTSSKAREWITVVVDQESNFLTLELKKENARQPIVISAIRIHCKPGSLTSN